jgi:hypothetical protein
VSHYRPSRIAAVCVGAALITFVADVFTPRGVAESCLYSVVVFTALRSPTYRLVLGLAVLCSLLTVLGFFVSPENSEPWKSLVNRAIALAGIWIVAALGLNRERLLHERARLNAERESALTRALTQFIPICAWCKKVRNEQDAWGSLEEYVGAKTQAAFTHGICPDCLRSVTAELPGEEEALGVR